MPHDRMLATRRTYTWIHKYIFPGGLIPSVTAIEEILDAAGCGSRTATTSARTTRRRCGSGATASPPVPTRCGPWVSTRCSWRMWKFYLSYSEAGFRSGYLDVCQLTLSEGPMTRAAAGHAAPPAQANGPDEGVAATIADLATQLGLDGSCRSGSAPGMAPRRARPPVPTLVLRSPLALRRLLWHPGELGLAQAYVTGELDVDGDLDEGLRRVWNATRRATGVQPHLHQKSQASAGAPPGRRLGRPPRRGPPARPRCPAARARQPAQGEGAPPQPGPRPRGHRRPLRRPARVLRADPGPPDGLLVRLVDLGRPGLHPGRRPARQAGTDLQQAQPGTRGPAARHRLRLGFAHPVRRPGVPGPGHRGHAVGPAGRLRDCAACANWAWSRWSTSRSSDYRDITGDGYDAIASVEMGEHVGAEQYPGSAPRCTTTSAPAARSSSSRCPGPAGPPAAARSSSRSSPPTCTCARWGRRSACWSGPGWRSGRPGHAGTLRPYHPGLAAELRRPRPEIAQWLTRRRGPRLAAVPGRRRAGVRTGPHGRRPDPRHPPRR